MALFRKKTSSTTNIPELQEYYANQKKENSGMAWLFAVGSLLVTAALLIALFFGGRFVYRKIAHRNDTKTVATTTTTTTTKTTPATTPSTTPSTTTTTTPTTTAAPGVSTTQSTTANSSATAATTSTSTVTPATTPQVPNTGPGNTIGLFVAVTLVSYIAHRAYVSRRQN